MSDRLDNIEKILERTATQQARNTDEIETLLGAVATTEASVQKTDAAVQKLTTKAGDTDQRFETLRAEASVDRQETRRMWNDAVTQMNTDRAEYREKFDRAIEQMNTDRAKADERHAAQMEVIQTLLLELTKSNGNINTLRDRVDGLEAAS
ncbi:MAG: hypothetical protein AAFV85_26760 [Cyanobacteria bacterium J06634_6]